MSATPITLSAGKPDEAAPRSRWIPWVFFGFFVVVFAVNMVMLTFALRSFNGLSTESPYDRGLAYGDTLDAYAAQRALGWTLDLAYAGTVGDGQLTLAATDRNGDPVTEAVVTGELRRPVHAGDDVAVTLIEQAPGRYAVAPALPLPGVWEVRLTLVRDGQDYELRDRIFVR